MFWPIAGFVVVGLAWAYAWYQVRAASIGAALHIQKRQLEREPMTVKEASKVVGARGLAVIDPSDAPRFVEHLGYAVLPRDKYVELLQVVRDAEPPFDVEKFLTEIAAWRERRDTHDG